MAEGGAATKLGGRPGIREVDDIEDPGRDTETNPGLGAVGATSGTPLAYINLLEIPASEASPKLEPNVADCGDTSGGPGEGLGGRVSPFA